MIYCLTTELQELQIYKELYDIEEESEDFLSGKIRPELKKVYVTCWFSYRNTDETSGLAKCIW